MGWASGSRLFNDVWETVRPHLRVADLVPVCVELMRAFELKDCDTLAEAMCREWPEVEEAYYTLHPDYRDDEEEADEDG